MVKKVLKVSHNSIFSRLIFFKSYWEFTGGISTQVRWMESLQSTSVLLFIGLTSFQSSLFERFVFFLRLFKALFVNFQQLLFAFFKYFVFPFLRKSFFVRFSKFCCLKQPFLKISISVEFIFTIAAEGFKSTFVLLFSLQFLAFLSLRQIEKSWLVLN